MVLRSVGVVTVATISSSHTRRPAGRKPAVTEELRRAIAELVAKGFTENEAARLSGVKPGTFRSTKSLDASFAAMIEEARGQRVKTLLAGIEEAARGIAGKPPDWRAAAWILERTEPDRFAARRPEVSVQTTVNQSFHVTPQLSQTISSAARNLPRKTFVSTNTSN